jgi:hypothetical protein
MDPVPDPLFLRECGSAENRTRDHWICNQELRLLDPIGGLGYLTERKELCVGIEISGVPIWVTSED